MAFIELMEQCERHGVSRRPSCTRRRAAARTPDSWLGGRSGASAGDPVPEVLAIGVAKGVNLGLPDILGLAGDTVELIDGRRGADRRRRRVRSTPAGSATTMPFPPSAGDAAIRWAARHGGWVLDRVVQREGLGGPARQRRVGSVAGGQRHRVHPHRRRPAVFARAVLRTACRDAHRPGSSVTA